MPNPIFNALHSGGQQPNMMQQFQSFMQQMRGQDPNALLNRLVSSGQVSQAQLNQAQQMAAMMQQLSAMQFANQQCCCDELAAIKDVKYTIAQEECTTRNLMQSNTRDIIDNQNSGINAIMGKLSQMEYNGLNDKYQAALAENQALKFQASQTAQNAFITANQEAQTAELLRRLGRDCPVPAYWVNPPTPVPVPCGTCNTCGC